MKRILSMGLAFVLLISCLAGCSSNTSQGGTDVSQTSQEGSNTGSAPKSGSIDVSQFEDSDIGVCLVINTNLGDKSICDLSYAGLQQIEADYGVN